MENPNIGTIDCETDTDNDGIKKIYSLGFITNLDPKAVIYYVDSKDNVNSGEIVLKLLDEILRPKYKNINFYCHNLGGYDVYFIWNILCHYNINNSDNEYGISSTFRDDRVVRLTISKYVNNEKRSISICDSYCILNDKLSKLSINF